MPYYFSAQINIHDENEYQKYIAQVDEVFSKFSGKYLAVDNNPQVLEGQWNYSRSVLIEFPSKEDFENWYYSEEYQKILKHRLSGANCNTILIEGLKNGR